MVYHNSCNTCHRQPPWEDKRRLSAPFPYHEEQHHAIYHTSKELVMQRSNLTAATAPAHPSTTLASQDHVYPAPSHQPLYGHHHSHGSIPCIHGQCSPAHKSWSSSYQHMHAATWPHEGPVRPYEPLPGAVAFSSHHPNSTQINLVGMHNNEDCIQFDPYLPNEPASCLGVLTPEQSPLAMLSTVREDRNYPSTPPPKAVSPTSAENNDDHSSLVQKLLVSSTPVMRSDGLKKRNAKFDIPKHRTIETIDHLISKEKDENVVKELKAQKRLLKNREAALQSRQRKKQRAEDLEKQVINLAAQLDAQGPTANDQLPFATAGSIARAPVTPEIDKPLLARMEALQKESLSMRQQNQKLTSENARLASELENTISEQTQEMARLRHENEQLLAQLQAKSDTPASTAFASSDYSDVVGEIDPIGFEQSFSYSEFPIENETTGSKANAKAADSKKSHIPPQLFVTLLLYGAHVASSTDQQASEMMHIPVLSSDDRTASTTMLQTLFDNANQRNRPQRTVSDIWRKPVDPAEVAYAYPRIIADLKSMFEDPAAPSKVCMPHIN